MRWICFLISTISYFSTFSQKTFFSGKIVDKANNAISGASVCLLSDSSNVLQYGYTNELGEYKLTTNKHALSNLVITVACLGYGKVTEKIPTDKHYSVITLSEKAEKLEEIVVESGKKITTKTDTTSIKASGFANNTEQTVEDILRKLPGIEVTKDGTIKAHGKSIDKLLVEGEDIFDKNYKLLSKNLDAKTLSEVQIIDHFEDNPVLKQLNNSEKVAINLTLKKDLKNVWFGNATVGNSFWGQSRFKLGTNVGLLKKRIKLFYFNNYNNLGEKASDVLATDVTTNENFGLDRLEQKTKPTYIIANNDIELLNKSQSNFNTAGLNAISFSSTLKKHLVLRGVMYATGDKQQQLSQAFTTYHLPQVPFSITEQNRYSDIKRNRAFEINVRYTPNNKNFYNNLLVINQQPNTLSNQLVFNGLLIHQDLNFTNKSVVNHFNHTKRISGNCLFNNYLYIGLANTSEKTNIISPVLNDLLGLNLSSPLEQKGTNNTYYLGNQYKWIIKYKKWDVVCGLRAEISNQQLQYTFTNENKNFGEYQNTLRLRQFNIIQNNLFQYHISKQCIMALELNVQQFFRKINFIDKKYLLMNPILRVRAEKTTIGNVSLTISQNNNLPDISQLTSNYQMVDYRSFYRGVNLSQPLKNTSINISHNYFNEEKRFSVTTNIACNDAKIFLNAVSTASKDFIFNSAIIGQGNKNYQLNCKFTNYIRKLQLASKIEMESNWMVNPINVNDTKFQSLKSRVQSVKYTATSYFKLPVNVDIGFTINFSQSNFESVQTNNHTRDAFVNMHYQASKSLLLESNTSIYYINHQYYLFQNMNLGWNPTNKKFSYKLFLNNLSNTNQFTYILLNNYIFYKSMVQIVPRYLLFTIKYRF